MKRGDIILVPFPFQDKLGEKIRPAVVVQSDAETARLINTVVAMITGNTDDAGRPTTLLVDPSTPHQWSTTMPHLNHWSRYLCTLLP